MRGPLSALLAVALVAAGVPGPSIAHAWGETETGVGLVSKGPTLSWPWSYAFVDQRTSLQIAADLEDGAWTVSLLPAFLVRAPGWASFLLYVQSVTWGGFGREIRAKAKGRGVVLFLYEPFGIPVWYHINPQ